jgi:predicted transport protein
VLARHEGAARRRPAARRPGGLSVARCCFRVGRSSEAGRYFAGKRAFGSVKALNSKVVVFLVLDPDATVAQNPAVMRDLTGMGHHGNGNVEYSLTNADQLPAIRQLIAQAHQQAQ